MEKQKSFDMSLEECLALFLNEKKLEKPTTQLFRINNHEAGRYYYAYNDAGEPVYFISVTTLIKNTMPTSPHLIKWIADMGADEAKQYAEERAGYGTFMHIQFTKLIIERKLDLDKIGEELEVYMVANHYPRSLFTQWLKDVKDDCLAMAQFIKDCKVEPLAVEVVLGSIENGYAGAVDLVCKMEIEVKGFFGETYKTGDKKGHPKETKMQKVITAIVDFKSGRKNFYRDNEIQLAAYKVLVEENFKGIKVDRVFNFSPKEWRKKPDYNLKDQTDSREAEKLPLLAQLAKIDKKNMNMSITVVRGIIDLDSDKELEENCIEYPLDEYVKMKREEKRQKAAAQDAQEIGETTE